MAANTEEVKNDSKPDTETLNVYVSNSKPAASLYELSNQKLIKKTQSKKEKETSTL
jgi:hypothetical protein